MCAGTGLKITQYSLLSHVVQLGPIRRSDLAQRMQLDASTLTRNLQPLVAHGWIDAGPGADARSRLVSATDAGRAKRAEAQRAWKQAQLALNAAPRRCARRAPARADRRLPGRSRCSRRRGLAR